LAADVAGYSRLTGVDEEGTHAQLQDHLRSLVDPKIAEHGGRVVKNTGDGLLAEFSSVVDAMLCAVDVQRGMAERNADVPQERRIEFRIGINVGDVMIDRGDIFGDGVNVAARLQGIAEPGGICVSGRAQEDVEGKLEISFENAGEHPLQAAVDKGGTFLKSLRNMTDALASPVMRLIGPDERWQREQLRLRSPPVRLCCPRRAIAVAKFSKPMVIDEIT
jgi:hypothetical protein